MPARKKAKSRTFWIRCGRDYFRSVEVLSPSTRMKAQGTKLIKYLHAGVRECWLIDTERRTVMTYYFEEQPYTRFYGFMDSVPVRIYDGELKINLSGILPWLEEGERQAP